jgi:ferredoxin
MGDDALLEINPELDDAQWQSVQDAADSCPTQAIILRD